MARSDKNGRGQDDPRITDLARYRRARERERRKPPPKAAQPAGSDQSLLGGRRNAPLILGAVLLLFLALWLGPALLAR